MIFDEAGTVTGFVVKYDQFVEEVRSILGQDQLAGIAMGSGGPPNSDGTFGWGGFIRSPLARLLTPKVSVIYRRHAFFAGEGSSKCVQRT